jgi:molybdopterin converting factor subunit 1
VKVNVRLFAVARELAGADSVELELSSGAKVAELRQSLLNRLPQLRQFGQQLRFAVDTDYADDSTLIPPTADIACIPPVSGG